MRRTSPSSKQLSNCTITVMRQPSGQIVYGPVKAHIAQPPRAAYANPINQPDKNTLDGRETSTTVIFVDYAPINPTTGKRTYYPLLTDIISVTSSPDAGNDGLYAIFEVPRPNPAPKSMSRRLPSFWELRCRALTPERPETDNNAPNRNDDSGTLRFA